MHTPRTEINKPQAPQTHPLARKRALQLHSPVRLRRLNTLGPTNSESPQGPGDKEEKPLMSKPVEAPQNPAGAVERPAALRIPNPRRRAPSSIRINRVASGHNRRRPGCHGPADIRMYVCMYRRGARPGPVAAFCRLCRRSRHRAGPSRLGYGRASRIADAQKRNWPDTEYRASRGP